MFSPDTSNVENGQCMAVPVFAAVWVLLLAGIAAGKICPDHCVCQASETVIRVDCTGEEIAQIPAGIPHNVTELRITRANITTLPADVFSPLLFMTSLTISQSKVKVVEDHAFRGLQNLRYLDLHGNELVDFGQDAFAGIPNLASLSLSENNLNCVRRWYFKNITDVGKIFLNNNSIADVEEGSFASLDNLTTLNLSFNRLTSISSTLLSGLVNLKYVMFAHNSISDISVDAFADSPDIAYLWLSFNNLSSLPSDIFTHFKALYFLSLASNAFAKVPVAVWRNRTHLQSLVLNFNPFTHIPSEAFIGLTSLMYLVIDHCPLLSKIEENAFAGLGSLVTLSLEHNVKLSILEAKSFPRDSLSNVTNLYIRNNTIKYLDENVLLQFTKLHTARIEMNPLNCTCALKWMRQAMDDDSNNVAREWKRDPHVPTCRYPQNLIGYKLTNLYTDDMTCDKPRLEAANENPWVEEHGMAVFQVSLSRGVPGTRWWSSMSQKWIYPQKADNRSNDNVFAMESKNEYSKVLASLTIVNVTDSQLGNYTLEATNGGGALYVQFNLAFAPQQPPTSPPVERPASGPEVAAIVFCIFGGLLVGALIVGAYFVSKRRQRQYPESDSRAPLLTDDSDSGLPAARDMRRFDSSYGSVRT